MTVTLFIGYLWKQNGLLMDKLSYVYTIASRYTPPDVYEEDGEIYGDFPEEVIRFMDIADGHRSYSFPCSYEKFCADKDIMVIIDSYNARIGKDGKKVLPIDREALYYGAMFVYYLTENRCTNAKLSPDSVRQQLLGLRESLSDAGRFTLVAERLESNGKGNTRYVEKEPVRVHSKAVVANLMHCIDRLLMQDSLYFQFDSSGNGTGHSIPIDSSEIDIYAKDDRVTYAATRKAKIAAGMLQYLFSEMHLPDLRARKSLDVTEFDGMDERSYSINRLIVLLLNLMRYTDSRNEDFLKSLKSKYRDFDPNTLTGW